MCCLGEMYVLDEGYLQVIRKSIFRCLEIGYKNSPLTKKKHLISH